MSHFPTPFYKTDKDVDPDILTKIQRPIKQKKNQMPEVLEKYPISKIIDSCIKKKAEGIIKKNKEFRLTMFKLIPSFQTHNKFRSMNGYANSFTC